MSRWVSVLAPLALGLAIAPAAHAAPLSLGSAVAAALATSPSLRGSNAKVEGARAKLDSADARTRPSVSLGITPLHLGILDPALSGMLSSLAPGLSTNLLSETLTVSQVLYDGGRSALGHQAAETGIALADEAYRLGRQTVAYDTANGYLNVLRAESLLQATLLAERSTVQHLNDAQTREKAGLASHFDTLQAQTALATIQARAIQARNAVKLARLSLGTAVHQDLSQRPLDPAPSLPTVQVEPARLDTDLAGRPELAISRYQQQLDALSTEITARDRLPVAAVQGILAAQGTSLPGYILMGSLSWTLYDGSKTDADVRAGQQTQRADEASAASLSEGLRLEFEKALADRSEAHDRLLATEQGLRTAQAGYDLANLRYHEGAGSGTEALDATSALSQAQSGYIQATYDALGAELKLAKAVGIDLEGLLTRPVGPRS